MVYAGKHAKNRSARDTGNALGGRGSSDGCAVPRQAGTTPSLDTPLEALDRDSDDRQDRIRDLLGSIRLQSPIYLEGRRSEPETPRRPPREDTVPLVVLRESPPGTPRGRRPPRGAAGRLTGEDSVDGDAHQERVRRLSGSIFLKFPPYRPANP